MALLCRWSTRSYWQDLQRFARELQRFENPVADRVSRVAYFDCPVGLDVRVSPSSAHKTTNSSLV